MYVLRGRAMVRPSAAFRAEAAREDAQT